MIKLSKSFFKQINSSYQIPKKTEEECPTILDSITKKLKTVKELKTRIKERLASLQLKKRAHLRGRVLAADPTRRKFWRFLKQQFKSAGKITAVKTSSGEMKFDQNEIEDVILDHFSEVFSASPVPNNIHEDTASQVKQSLESLDQLLDDSEADAPETNKYEDIVCAPYTFTELEDTLQELPNNKASGYDRINNELLKNSGSTAKRMLLIFLNKIMEEGSVPECLNHGKCMLIHKVESREPLIIIKNTQLQGGDTMTPMNYRPITIPSNILRLITLRLSKRMSSIVEENNLLGMEQFGFRRGRSTIDAAYLLNTLMHKTRSNR